MSIRIKRFTLSSYAQPMVNGVGNYDHDDGDENPPRESGVKLSVLVRWFLINHASSFLKLTPAVYSSRHGSAVSVLTPWSRTSVWRRWRREFPRAPRAFSRHRFA